MIFKPELVRKIQAGKKTMTRRPMKPGEKDCRYKAGRVYSIQPGRGRRAVCQVTVTAVRLEPLGWLSLDDARREGFRTTEAFYDYWHRLYGPPATAGVRRLERERVALEVEGLVDSNIEVAALIASIDESRGARMERLPLPPTPCIVWVISFEKGDVRPDVPRLLRSGPPAETICTAMIDTPKGRKPCLTGIPAPEKPDDPRYCPRCGRLAPLDLEDDHGYIRKDIPAGGRPVEKPYGSMNHEPEAVSDDYQRRITKEAREAERHRSLGPFRTRTARLTTELEELRKELDEGPYDRELTRQVGRIERALAAINGQVAAAA